MYVSEITDSQFLYMYVHCGSKNEPLLYFQIIFKNIGQY